MAAYWTSWVRNIPSFRAEEAWRRTTVLLEELTQTWEQTWKKKIQLVGDDLFVGDHTESCPLGITEGIATPY